MSKFANRLKNIMLTYDSFRNFVNNSPTALKGFTEKVELLAADTYAHPTHEGWCCACDADIAFAAKWMLNEPEYKKAVAMELRNVLLMNGQHEGDWKESIKQRIADYEKE